uniref:PH domain-containing protein n=1 Tax=Kwoniella dejecticola CBS 10117 TaxID=1296121 RepID=A0A1A6A3E8_9TREE|nr:uncharacterized protein I303_05441 [Kwoniella dejecticola CBS 10117]OBR84582.1 hypothetical protein I303_05441 [Kwoniella dejecticola CBS 10117]
MPAIPQSSSSNRAPPKHFTPPDPNRSHDESTHGTHSQNPTLQPSARVVDSTSHNDFEAHFLPRRFLGAIPQKVINSDETQEKKRRFKELRRNALNHLPGLRSRDDLEEYDNRTSGSSFIAPDDNDTGAVREFAGRLRIKIRKKNRHGEEYEENLNLDLDSDGDAEDGGRTEVETAGKGKSSKSKNVWLGESFDIGREFLGNVIREEEEEEEEGNNEEHEEEEEPPPQPNAGTAAVKGKSKAKTTESTTPRPTRPSPSTRTTQDTFVTARTAFSSSYDAASSSKSSLATNADEGAVGGYELTPQLSLGIEQDQNHRDTARTSEETLERNKLRKSQSSSIQPLMSSTAITDEPSEVKSGETNKPDTDQAALNHSLSLPKDRGKGITRLKSALRKSSKPNIKASQSTYHPSSASTSPAAAVAVMEGDKGKSKSVQFPLDLTSPTIAAQTGNGIRLGKKDKLKGDKDPVHPMEVLERSGEDAIGTSHEAVEEAQEEEEDWEEVKRPGEVILRDRMIVKIGYHREDKLSGFDEAAQRRNPCARLDPLEEYIVVYRKGQLELYSNYTYPFQEKIVGHKHLAFVIPLLPNRTSLSIFNPEDVTLCLTTSVHKLQDDVTYLMRSNTTRAGALKDKVKQSKQVQWLRGRRRGSQVFIFKLGERSRSLDWYWEIWRELNGELPDRFDIAIPSLSTSIRLFPNLPDPDSENPNQNPYDMVGSAEQCKAFERNKVIDNCYNMLLDSSLDIKDLRNQFESSRKPGARGEQLNLQLAWKSADGNLDWIAYSDTVQGKRRDWNLLSGLARSQVSKAPRELQLRPAKHQPSDIKLEDGTLLEEPPGVEGYLVRHKDGTTKEQVYISSHDGNIFVGNFKDAKPPLLPSKESSTPSDLFPDLFKNFIEGEHRRLSSFLERCSGCIDLRDIVEEGAEAEAGTETETETGTTFEVEVNTGGKVRLEATSAEIAKEWVERLKDLKRYWERRHRVDARQRMDAITLHSHRNPFTGTELSNESDNFISEIWDWCVIKGCRSTCISGRLFMRKDKWDKFRSKYIVLTGGTLVSFKIKKKNAFHTRKKRYPLFGAYVYSGMLALDELPSPNSNDIFTSQSRVYQDGLQSSDGAEDTTFCVRLTTSPYSSTNSSKKAWTTRKKVTQPWENEDLTQDQEFLPPDLSKNPNQLLIFRARSKLERDRWVWAINAEMERQVRSHIKQEEILRNHGNVPDRW